MKTIQSIAIALALIVGTALSAASQSAQPAPFSEAELDQMLAPVALYPDTVLSHVLIAATYPLEVVQAARWSRHNPSMRGEEAVAAVERQNWDPSVKALVAFPELLARMDEDLEWTQRLGDAFLMQEEEVVDTVQYLRSEAYAQGHLKSNDHVRVVRETQYIYIEPARTQVVYVPYYDPRVVYTRWRWSSHPPVYWHHPPAYRSSVVFYWGPAYRVAPSFYFSSFHWSRRQVVSVHHHHHHYHRHVHTHRHFSSGRDIARHSSARHWQHNPTHRRGVSYRPGTDQRRFVQQQRDSAASARSASARASSPQRARTISQQRQWADQQRSAAPLRERSQARSQARSSDARTSQRSDAGSRIQRDTGSSSATTTRRASSARNEASAPRTATRSEASAPRTTTRSEASAPRSSATRADHRVENRTQRSAPARAATARPDSGAQTATRATAAPRSEAPRSQAQASSPASSQRQGPSATARQAQAPRAAQSVRQPQASSSPAATRQSQPAQSPSTQSSAPTRATTTAPRSSNRSSAAPRSTAPSRSTGARSSAPRGGDTRRATRRQD